MTVQVSQSTYDLLVSMRDNNADAITAFEQQLTQVQANLDEVTARRDELTQVIADLEVE